MANKREKGEEKRNITREGDKRRPEREKEK